MKRKLLFLIGIITIAALYYYTQTYKTNASTINETKTLWKYQCIDTMKFSRDNARSLSKNPNLPMLINTQLTAIKDMGANCVAIGTPYNNEFIPYLSAWVKVAREKGLHVWFRGNFAEWEGWFNYPKFKDINDHHKKIYDFITANSTLFQDGDVFMPATEPENGGLGDPRSASDKADAFNKFIVNSYNNCKNAFAQINKHVECGYFSMNGDVAKDILTKDTISAIGGTATIDHYVSSVDGMESYIKEIHDKLQANVVLGEYGAPIPDLNGPMSPDDQAKFVEILLKNLYSHRDIIPGVNYWVLSDSSTALLNPDGSPRPVVDVIKKYYKPAVIYGTVKSLTGKPLQNVHVATSDGLAVAQTDAFGKFQLVVPAEDTVIDIDSTGYFSTARKISISKGGVFNETITLETYKENFFDTFKNNIILMWHFLFKK